MSAAACWELRGHSPFLPMSGGPQGHNFGGVTFAGVEMRTEDLSEKTCCDCTATLPIGEFYIYAKSGNPYPRCKKCHMAYSVAWQRANKDKVRQIEAKHRQKHAEKLREASRQYGAKNRDRRAALWAEYYPANAARICEAARLRRVGDLETHRERDRAYRVANPVPHQLSEARRRAKKKACGGQVTAAEWLSILTYFGHACAYCLCQCENLTMDHIEPLSRGGAHAAENIVPACRPCNSRKSDKVLIFAVGVLA
jgi:5-methylcytosine-specific restriction endonuclease McrA